MFTFAIVLNHNFNQFMKKKLVFILMSLLFVVGAYAQRMVTVQGVVTDATFKEPVIGANIVVKGTTLGTICDVDGKYVLENVPADGTLVFSFIGMKTVEVKVDGKTTVNVELSDDVQKLEDVVVIGYGTSKAKDLTAPISVVKSDQIASQATTSPMSALQGKVPGMNVVSSGAPGSGPKVTIRGLGSFGDTSPLYVVDGMFYDNINFLNNSDIQEISVLKDASAAAIYGVRAANGVVIITTKKGKRNTKARITYNGYVGVQTATNVLDMANSHEYATLVLEANRQAYEPLVKASIEKFGGNYDSLTFGADTDWYDELLRPALMTNHGVDIAGGSEKATYAVGVNYLYQNGIMDTRNSYNRLNFRANFDFEATDWLKVGSNIVISNSEQYNAENSAWLAAYNMPSLIPVYDYSRSDDEAFPEKFASPQQIGLTNNFSNPVAIAKYNNNSLNENFQVMANFFAELNLIPNKLKFKTSYSQDFSLIRGRVYVQPYLVSSLQQNSESRLTKTDTNYYNYIWDNTLTYTDSWGSHNLNVLLGQSARQEQMRKLEGKATNVPGDYDEYLYLTQGNATGREVSDDGSCYRGLSYFARASYDYAGKYLLSLTMRADGSSKYQNKWGYFPSVGAAWVMSDEDFFKKQEVIDYMKVRASWGQLGNDHVSASDGFASIVTGTSASGVFGNTTLPGFQNTSYFSWLGWEKVEEFNVGVNFAVLDSRLNVDVDYYNRMTKNAVISTTLPFSTQTLAGNNGEIENSGVDIQLNWCDKIGKDFSYYAGVNLSTLRNRVKSLNGAPYIYGGSAESRTINLVGEEMQSYYGYKVLGVYQNQAQIDADPIAKANGLEPGDFIYEDINNDQVIDDKDRQILGSNIPRLTYSFNLGFQYKNLEFSLSTFGQAGNEIYNRKRAVRYTQANFNFDKDFYDNRWTGEGSTNTYPSAKGMLKAWNNSHTNSFFVEKGNFFRIQNIMLAYNFRNIRMGGYTLPGVKLSLTADRPFTYFTSNGFTPEISQNFGWDEGVYPLAATYTFGLTIDF